jgi:putative membrane protein
MMVLMLGIVALVVWLIVRSSHGSGGLPSSSAREILSERFARGEIDADEYHDRLSKLR